MKNRTLIWYAAATVCCIAFGQIYEYFGFGVTSRYMHLAFLIPLLLGLLPALAGTRGRFFCTGTGRMFWRLGVLTLTIGSLFRGALDIYGTQSALTVVYPVAGGVCLAAGVIVFAGYRGSGEESVS